MRFCRSSSLALMWAVAVATLAAACGDAPKPSVELGRTVYRQNGCASCHGPEGHGNGPVSKTLDPKPRDFRDASAFKRGTDSFSIAKTIATGVANRESQGMPSFGHLTAEERRSLALYIISLRESSRKGTNP